MERYDGKNKKIEALAEMSISDTALGIVVQNGYDETKEMIEEGSYEVLSSYFDIWFERCPELKEKAIIWVESAYECKSMTDGMLKRKLLKRADFRTLCAIIARARVKACRTIPFFLKTLFEAVLSENAVLYCNSSSLDTLCGEYFAEIEEYMTYNED